MLDFQFQSFYVLMLQTHTIAVHRLEKHKISMISSISLTHSMIQHSALPFFRTSTIFFVKFISKKSPTGAQLYQQMNSQDTFWKAGPSTTITWSYNYHLLKSTDAYSNRINKLCHFHEYINDGDEEHTQRRTWCQNNHAEIKISSVIKSMYHICIYLYHTYIVILKSLLQKSLALSYFRFFIEAQNNFIAKKVLCHSTSYHGVIDN